MNSKKLKIIAVIAMLVDHLICQYYGPDFFCLRDIAEMSLQDYFINYPAIWDFANAAIKTLTFLVISVGRMAAVLFFFLLANGYQHTHSVKRYITRLLIFGALAQIPYTLFDEGQLIPLTQMRFNIMFTLAAALFALWCSEKLRKKPVLAAAAVLAVTWLTVWLDLEYSYQCVAFVFFFYYSRNMSWPKRLALGLLLGAGLQLWRFHDLLTDPRFYRTIGYYIAGNWLAVLLAVKYNGEKGKQSKAFQYFFYGFYPGHLLVLGIIQTVLYSAGGGI